MCRLPGWTPCGRCRGGEAELGPSALWACVASALDQAPGLWRCSDAASHSVRGLYAGFSVTRELQTGGGNVLSAPVMKAERSPLPRARWNSMSQPFWNHHTDKTNSVPWSGPPHRTSEPWDTAGWLRAVVRGQWPQRPVLPVSESPLPSPVCLRRENPKLWS